MRLLVWTLGVICTMHALADAYAIAPRWVWVFWTWLGLWVLAGLVVLGAAVVGVISRAPSQRVAAPSVPRRSALPGQQGGE